MTFEIDFNSERLREVVEWMSGNVGPFGSTWKWTWQDGDNGRSIRVEILHGDSKYIETLYRLRFGK